MPGPTPDAPKSAPEQTSEQILRRALTRYGRSVARLGFTPGTSGNLSARLTPTTLLVTPTGLPKAMLRPADMILTDLQGNQLAGTRRVTSEIGMHLAVYRARPDVLAVIHAHPPIATAFACSGRSLDDCLCQEALMTLGIVPLAPYATTGTDEVAQSLTLYLPHHDAILLANHGVITAGIAPAGAGMSSDVFASPDALLDAYLKLETLEHIAQVSLIAHQLGTPKPLQPHQIQQLHYAKSRYLQNTASNPSPAASPLTPSLHPKLTES